MKRETELQKRIANRDTELHRFYDYHFAGLEWVLEERERLQKELAVLDDKELKYRGMIDKCKRRAAEQGYPNLFD